MPDAYTALKSSKRRKFIDLLCIGQYSNSECALQAGFSPKRPDVAAAKLLAIPEVKAALDERRRQLAEQAGLDAMRVLHELAKIGFANMRDFITVQSDGGAVIDLKNLTRDQAAAIAEITVDEYVEGNGDAARAVKRVKVKLAEKKGPLELLGKYFKLWTDKAELAGPGGMPLAPPVFNFGFKNGGPGQRADTSAEGS